ncbi:MAG: hypothetical protein E7Z89_08035 [Cyanobacteria bacterium SIG28]|nr:hypothetical protein [Cyanobacteria bacterium SIG28]
MNNYLNYGTNVSFQARSKWLTGIKKKLNKEQLSKLSEEIKFAEKEIEKTLIELRKPNYETFSTWVMPHYYIEGMEKRLAELRAQYNKLL